MHFPTTLELITLVNNNGVGKGMINIIQLLKQLRDNVGLIRGTRVMHGWSQRKEKKALGKQNQDVIAKNRK